MGNSKKGIKISVIVVLVLFIIFMGLSSFLYLAGPKNSNNSKQTSGSIDSQKISNTGNYVQTGN